MSIYVLCVCWSILQAHFVYSFSILIIFRATFRTYNSGSHTDYFYINIPFVRVGNKLFEIPQHGVDSDANCQNLQVHVKLQERINGLSIFSEIGVRYYVKK